MDTSNNLLGSFLKDRRARLDPAAFGLPLSRRRTPGLRREEIAQLAHVSATWYTWLEQGRGGAPSVDVLDRLARAFGLSATEREHMFLLAQERPPKTQRAVSAEVGPQLQRVLDAFVDSPALVKTPEWTVLAWNAAATVIFTDYGKVAPADRNVLRILFREGGHDHLPDWESVARLIVGTMRRDVLRAGMQEQTSVLIDDLNAQSADFRRLWAEQDVSAHGEGLKEIRHPVAGSLKLEYSTFAVDGRPDLALVVFNPATPEDRNKVRQLIDAAAKS